ncbi:DMT family transporter [Pararhodobacter oceanensis]|uniref:DMT family transporter n=1 Tax=Pararhodobacter oceanensis TaxID=2172121 RepID=UPI003A8CB365
MSMTQAGNRTLAAALCILGYAVLIGFVDNFVREIALIGGLWQFQLMRSAMAAAMMGLLALPLALRLRPVNFRAVAARSLAHGTGILIYFGSLGFLSVAQASAGLFAAPIFVLLLARFYGHRIGVLRLLAALVGFVGVLMVLQPGAQSDLDWRSLVPLAAGAFYALGNVATREWCAQESAATLTLGFFIVLGLAGALGLAVLAVTAPPVPEGAAGFLTRGWLWPSPAFLGWTLLQAVGSMLAIALLVTGYQIAEASRVTIFEYVLLPVVAGWSYLLWQEPLSLSAAIGIVLIIGAGALMVLRSR